MKRANEDSEIEVKEDEIQQETENQQTVENVDQKLETEVKNSEEVNLNDENPAKRRRKNEDNIELRLLIPTKTAGAIIGKNGQNIQKLRSDHDAKINIVDCKGPERVLTITSCLDEAYKVIRDIMKYYELSKLKEYDFRFLVHQSLAGCIIGKGGSKIKELKNTFGCHLKVFPNVAPQSFERVVQIIANEDKCINALTEIMNLTKSNNIRGAVRFYDPHNFDDIYADEYGGFAIGSSRNFNPPRQRIFNNNNSIGTNFNNNNNIRGKLNNDRRGDNRRNVLVKNPINNNNNNYVDPWASNNYSNRQQIPQMNNFGSNNMTGDYVNFNNNFANNSDETSTQVSIPINLAGACIGKGGSRIRNIRNESKANIKIDQPLPGSNDRIITITGTPKQIQAAQYLLQQSVQNGMN